MIAYFRQLYQRWGGKVGFSIVDQGIFSGSNFILHIFLARQIPPSEYGIFAIAFSIFLFLSGFHQALVLESISVIGASRYKDRLNTYLPAVIWIHCVLTLIFSAILLALAVIMKFKNYALSSSFFGLSIATPLILFFWLFQRVCYLKTRPDLSLKGSLVYAFLLFSGLAIVYKKGWVSPFNTLFIMGFASLGVIIIFRRFLDVKIIDLYWGKVKFAVKDALRENWRYGKWVMGSAFTYWISFMFYLPLVGVFAGTEAAGAFRAMQNLLLPLQKILVALTLLFLPWMSRQHAIEGKNYLKRNLHRFILAIFCLSSGYVIILVLFKETIVKLLYGSGYYSNFIWLLPLLGLVVILESVSCGLIVGLKALRRSDAVFWSQAVAVVVTLTLGLYLVKSLKLYGAVIGSLCTIFVIVMMSLYFLWRYLRRATV